MSENIQRQYPVLVGIGCGRTIHSRQMPIDLAIYLKGADIIRERVTRNQKERRGVVVLADIEVVEQDDELEKITIFRRERLQKTLAVLKLEQWDIVMQSEITRNDLSEIHIDEKLRRELPEEDVRYIEREMDDGRKLIARNGTKIGWVKDLNLLTGGERIFDDQISVLRPDIRYAYEVTRASQDRRTFPRLIGVPLSSKQGEIKPPYLVKKPDEHLRLCLPTDTTQLEREMVKLKKTILSGLAVQRIKDFCAIVRTSVGITLEGNKRPSLQEQTEQALRLFLR